MGTNVASPPIEVAPAAINAVVVVQNGHMKVFAYKSSAGRVE
jgi:hypothetical protein